MSPSARHAAVRTSRLPQLHRLVAVALGVASLAATPRQSGESSAFSALRSAEILEDEEPLYLAPGLSPKRRGSAAKGVRLPLYGAQYAPGCASGKWFHVGPQAWLCSDRVRESTSPPIAAATEPVLVDDGLLYEYAFVRDEGSFGYADLQGADFAVPQVQYEPGFALALLGTARGPTGESYGLTGNRLWVPIRDLRPVRAPLFEGLWNRNLLQTTSELGWIIDDEVSIRLAPGANPTGGSLSRGTRVRIGEQTRAHGREWVRIGAQQWVPRAAVRIRRPVDPPGGLYPRERWLDVDTRTQILTAYEGQRPVFATLVSTGKGRPGSENATPPGSYRVWVKLKASDMDNLESNGPGRHYAIQRVPWVMYFHKGYGLHGTFWHREFGNVRSHGCVNLSPRDAQRLFHWAAPRLPAGWTAVLPTRYDPGTLVSVR